MEAEQRVDPGNDPPPHTSGKQKRIRKNPDELRARAEAGDRNYAICVRCDTPYSVRNKHNCHVNVKKRKAIADVTKVVRTISCTKRFLPSTIKLAYRSLVLAWMRQLVLAQHCIRLLAVHLLHAFVVDALQPVTLDTLQMVVEDDATPIMFLDKTIIRTALSLCSEPNNRQQQQDAPTPLRNYFQQVFSLGIPTILANRASAQHIAATSLQACATEIHTAWCVMMQTLVWSQTKAWIRMEMEHAHIQRRHVRDEWLYRHFASEKHLERLVVSLPTEAAVRAHYLAGGGATTASHEQAWDELYRRCLVHIHTRLLPFEWRVANRLVADDDMTDDHVASLRCTWLFAIQRRMEELAASKTERPILLKRFQLFPLSGWVPSHIPFDNKLLLQMPLDFRRCRRRRHSDQSNAWHDLLPSDTSALPSDWRDYFTMDARFWHDTSRPDDDERMCTAMVTDGVAVSYRKERTKIIQLPPPDNKKRKLVRGAIKTPEQVEQAKSYMKQKQHDKSLTYNEHQSLESLRERNIQGVLTIDTNRKNMFVAAYRSLEQLLHPHDASSASCRDIVIRFSKAELKHVRGTKHAAQVREAMAARPLPDAVDGATTAQAMMTAIPSMKGTSIDSIEQWKAYMEAGNRLGQLHAFHSLHTFRRLRMESYGAERHFWIHLQDKIYRELNRKLPPHKQLTVPRKTGALYADGTPRQATGGTTSPRILIAMGDGSFRHNSSGHLTMPDGHRMYEELQRLGEHMCWVDEYNTSKCCSCCGGILEQAVLCKKVAQPRTRPRRGQPPPAPPPDPGDAITPPRTRRYAASGDTVAICRHPKGDGSSTTTLAQHFYPLSTAATTTTTTRAITPSMRVGAVVSPWGLRVCRSTECGRNRIWCRDVNAVRNMLRRVGWSLLRGVGALGPAYLLRGSGQRPASPPVASHKPSTSLAPQSPSPPKETGPSIPRGVVMIYDLDHLPPMNPSETHGQQSICS